MMSVGQAHTTIAIYVARSDGRADRRELVTYEPCLYTTVGKGTSTVRPQEMRGELFVMVVQS